MHKHISLEVAVIKNVAFGYQIAITDQCYSYVLHGRSVDILCAWIL